MTPRYTGEAKLLLEVRESFYTRPGQERVDQPADRRAGGRQPGAGGHVARPRPRGRAAAAARRQPGIRSAGRRHRTAAPAPDPARPRQQPVSTFRPRIASSTTSTTGSWSIRSASRASSRSSSGRRTRSWRRAGANTIADLYLDLQEAAKKDTARSASTWLGPTIDELRARVSGGGSQGRSVPRPDRPVRAAPTRRINAQQLSDLNAQLAQARSAQAEAQAKARLIRDMIRLRQIFEIPDVANNELIRRLTEQSVNLRAQLALELRTLLGAASAHQGAECPARRSRGADPHGRRTHRAHPRERGAPRRRAGRDAADDRRRAEERRRRLERERGAAARARARGAGRSASSSNPT